MSISLSKGGTISLTKDGNNLTVVDMGAGWDPVVAGRDIDLDASVVALDDRGRECGIVWFGNKREFGRAIVHSGDNLTGQGDGDDEVITVDLRELPDNVRKLVFTITSFNGQGLGQVQNAYCRLVDKSNGVEIARYNLSDLKAATAQIMAVLVKDAAGTWQMTAVGQPTRGKTVKKLVKQIERSFG